MHMQHHSEGPHTLLFDEGCWPDADLAVFDPAAHAALGITVLGGGRNTALCWSRPQGDWVIRRYARGGVIGRLVNDHYLWTGLHATRAWREFHLLAELLAEGLPVPRPIAAHVVRAGLLYRQHLITERVPDAVSLEDLLRMGPVSEADWHALGQCVLRFHQAGVCHADLNPGNVLRDTRGQFYLLDFDRGGRRSGDRFQADVLARFLRSLHKRQRTFPRFHFDRIGWEAFLAGHGRPP